MPHSSDSEAEDELTLMLLLVEEMMEAEEEEEEDDQEEDIVLGELAAAMIEQAWEVGVRMRNTHCLYLVHHDLLSDPREATPWQRLYHSRNDRAFITTMGFDVQAFEQMLHGGFLHRWNSRMINYPNVHPGGHSHPNHCSLDASGALRLILHWVTLTMHILLETLKSMPEARITWPQTQSEFKHYNDLIIASFGTADGLNLPVQVSVDEDLQNATYNGWLHDHFISNVIAFASNGEIIHYTFNAPGSWHDSCIAHRLYEKLLTKTPPDYYLACDTAFPRSSSIDNRIKVPLKSNSRLPTDHSAEWGMRDLQGSDAHLHLKLLKLVGHLHQVHVCLVGINQIKNVYEPIWQDGDELQQLWFNWHTMLFKNARKADCVARFHHVANLE
ncbi:uncharacterized protein LAESUDRAFT_737564 [Laetiporus sulphureus 93-53]|uniref:DDE Tnp4 domain-containing protein n=1 Tax=Laetiporus sulphureus 93-53 TaxID=1314785 RepID=A0A165DM67_9APHY|nr:uncharacterized protein LAESUDRAFT_737564 [Laetiporus sulphureus 93-53]KZT05182.1 hypothetical protein LAESUDRAFT_737564 [Laetiporus sulphureus 93-53]